MKKLIPLAAIVAAAITFAFIYTNVQHHRVVRRQLQVAFAAVNTVVDYTGSSGAQAADMTARGKIDDIDSDGLNQSEANALDAISGYLSAVESLDSSMDIETTDLRTPIAQAAAQKAFDAMLPFQKK